MNIQGTYQEVEAALQQHDRVSVISRCAPGGGVEKRVVCPGDGAAWEQREQLRTNPNATLNGAVACVQEANGVLTLVEDYTARSRMIILGAGHIAIALAPIARAVGFDVVVFDDRPSFANSQRFPAPVRVICDSFERLFECVQPTSSDYIVVITRGHRYDSDCLQGILRGPRPAYLGMIGSRRRVSIVKEQLQQAGYSEERLAHMHSPIGLEIGAVTPAEIAISIIAEVIATRRIELAQTAPEGADMEAVAAIAADKIGPQALVTVIDTTGSVPTIPGAKLALTYTGQTCGTVGGGCGEAELINVARVAIRKETWCLHTIDLNDSAADEGMVCGGTMTALIEPC
jgi:xanthine dehydrogenase accessory factor